MTLHPTSHKWVAVKRDEALIRQGGRCKYCRCGLTRGTATADHRVPKAKGGTDSGATDALCWFCNQAKDRLSPLQFRKLLKSDGPLPWPANLCRASFRINTAADKAVKRIRRVHAPRHAQQQRRAA